MTKLAALPLYNAERARRLHHICTRLQRRIALGESFYKAAHRLASRWQGRPYKTCPNRRFKVSPHLLYGAYPKWLASPSPEAFNLNYRWNTTYRTAHYSGLARDLTAICLRPEVTSLAMAVRQLCQERRLSFSPRTGCRFFTPRQRMAALKVMKLHRDLNKAVNDLKAIQAKSEFRHSVQTP